MNLWYKKTAPSGACSICIAGAHILANKEYFYDTHIQNIEVPPYKSVFGEVEDVALRAFDDLRQGDMFSFLLMSGGSKVPRKNLESLYKGLQPIYDRFDELSDGKLPQYHPDCRSLFHRMMIECADYLEEQGL